jgi:hypothetical protein
MPEPSAFLLAMAAIAVGWMTTWDRFVNLYDLNRMRNHVGAGVAGAPEPGGVGSV